MHVKIKSKSNLSVFLFMPLQRVQIIGGKAAEGTYQGFSCVGLPYMSITAIFRTADCVALGAGPASIPWNNNHYWLILCLPLLGFDFFGWWGRRRWWCSRCILCEINWCRWWGGLPLQLPEGVQVNLPGLPPPLPPQTSSTHRQSFGGLLLPS